MPAPYSDLSSQTASDKLLAAQLALVSEQGVQSEAVTPREVPATMEWSPTQQEDTPQTPTVQSSSSPRMRWWRGPRKLVAATPRPPDEFREHQALLRRVVANLNLEVKELAEEPNDLFNVIPSSALARSHCLFAQVALPVYPGSRRLPSRCGRPHLPFRPRSRRRKRSPMSPPRGMNIYTCTLLWGPWSCLPSTKGSGKWHAQK